MSRLFTAGTVVLIADDAAQRAQAEALLSDCGFRVRSSGDADGGMEHVRRDGADVVVLGLEKRWQNLDLVRRLRGRFEAIPLPAPPRILVAAVDCDDAGEHFARRLGADAVVRHSLTEGETLDAVRHLARAKPERQGSASLCEAV